MILVLILLDSSNADLVELYNENFCALVQGRRNYNVMSLDEKYRVRTSRLSETKSSSFLAAKNK